MGHKEIKEFFISGASELPYPDMSAVAWVKSTRPKHPKISTYGWMTTTETARSAILEVVDYVAEGSRVRILTDSRLVSHEFKRIYDAKTRDLHDPYWRARAPIEKKDVSIEISLVKRTENLAHQVLNEFAVALRQICN